jgi:hypothetical protein
LAAPLVVGAKLGFTRWMDMIDADPGHDRSVLNVAELSRSSNVHLQRAAIQIQLVTDH